MADIEGEGTVVVEIVVEEVEIQEINAEGAPGPRGAQGFDAWTAIYGIVADGERRVMQLQGYVGGTGPMPDDILSYVGPEGPTEDIEEALDVRGLMGPEGPQGERGQDGAILVGEGSGIITGDGAPAADLGNPGDLYLDNLSSDVYSKKASAEAPDGVWTLQSNIRGQRGPDGARGPDGLQGLPGLAGANGWSPSFILVADGARTVMQLSGWINGTGSPPTTNVGAYLGAGAYVQNIADALNIRGAQGPVGVGTPGAQGSSFRWGAGVPSDVLGNNGDTYVDNSDVLLPLYYKAANAWTATAFYLKGASGQPGAKGDKGDKGDQGNPGAAGADSTVAGPRGLPGDKGDKGDQGNPGVAGADSTVPGPAGDDGAKGDKGDPGEPGAQGNPGTAGTPGVAGQSFRFGAGAPAQALGNDNDTYLRVDGFNIYTKAAGAWTDRGSIMGPAGAKGDQGNPGVQGNPGTAGTPGAPGTSFRYGVGVPGAGLGNDNDTYLRVDTFHIYVKGSGAWTDVGSIVGPAGQDGAKGDQGNPGVQGTPGTAGADGGTILTGAGAPAAGLGKNTDSYVNTTTGDTYGPKTAGAWGAITGNIRGIQGPPGADAIGAADISIFVPGKPTADQIVFIHDVVRNFSWPVNWAGSRFRSRVAATAAYVVTVRKNGAAIGTLSWAAGATACTGVLASVQNFVAGTDVITLTGQTTPDATLTDLILNFRGSR